jgi:hypothetical protein
VILVLLAVGRGSSTGWAGYGGENTSSSLPLTIGGENESRRAGDDKLLIEDLISELNLIINATTKDW